VTNQPSLTIEELQLFSADDAAHLFVHPLNRTVLYTPGVRYLMRRAEAYWLIDAVVS